MAPTLREAMLLMSEIALDVLPCPSAYRKLVTLGHFMASSLPEAVVTRRQELPPKPSSRAKVIFLVPHQAGAPATCVTLPLALPPEDPPLPQPARTRDREAAPTATSLV